MNRRDLFKFVAVGAAGLLVPSTVSYFLPPRFGWQPSQLGAGYMREVAQYVINFDSLCWRYDVIGRDIWGKEHQFNVIFYNRDRDPQSVRDALSSHLARDGLIAVPPGQSRELRLALPRGVMSARYI